MSVKVIRVPAKLWSLLLKAGILFVVCLLIGAMINFFSPHATITMDSEERFLFWVCLCLIGGIGIFACDIILTLLSVKWPELLKAFVQSVFGTVAVLVPLYEVYDPADIPIFSTSLIFVWTVMVLILIGTFILGLKIKKTEIKKPYSEVETSIEDIEVPAKILSRLPVHLQNSDLHAISAEDHYVRVHTSKGHAIILMRLSDAMLEIGTVEGLQVHRSWWVAKAAIDNIKPKGRAAEISLRNNIKAPVSRNSLKTLKNIGWL